MSDITYTKRVKLSIPVTNIMVDSIPALTSKQLSFYQKYIVLLLQRGFTASSKEELDELLSETLNFHIDCIKSFTEYLINERYVDYSAASGKFKLNDKLSVFIDKDSDNAMFADFETKEADCNKIVYVRGIDEYDIEKFFLESDFDSKCFKKKNLVDSDDEDLNIDIFYDFNANEDRIRALIVRFFENSRVKLKPNFDFSLNRERWNEYTLETDALLQYQYNEDRKESKRIQTILNCDATEVVKIIEECSKQYDNDNEIPRFITLADSFYKEIAKTGELIENVNNRIEDEYQESIPLREDIQNRKAELQSEVDAYNSRINEFQQNEDTIRQKLEKTDEEIGINDALISKTKANDNLIANLKRTVLELYKSKKELSNKIESSENEKKVLKEAFENKARTYQDEIDRQRIKLQESDKKASESEKERDNLKVKYDTLFEANMNQLEPVVQLVVKKYPVGDNIFNRYVSDISISLDKAVSASENGAVDELLSCVDNSRQMYRKILHIVFDTLLNQNKKSLGEYFGDKFNVIALQELFKKRKVNADILTKLIAYHDISNAWGHITDNGPKSESNKKLVEDFKTMKDADRKKLLLALPNFFKEISFTKDELKAFSAKMKV